MFGLESCKPQPCTVLTASPQDHFPTSQLHCIAPIARLARGAAACCLLSRLTHYVSFLSYNELHRATILENIKNHRETGFGGKTEECTLYGKQVRANAGGLGWVQQWRQDGPAACKQPPNAPSQLQQLIMAETNQSVVHKVQSGKLRNI